MTVSLSILLNRSIRNMGNVHPVVKESALEVIKRAYDEGIYVQISSGYRSYEEQRRLYNQGRSTSGNIVTNAESGESYHNHKLAVDYFLVSEDGNDSIWVVNSDWRRVAVIGKSLGFEWGGDWISFKDYPHLQMSDGLSVWQLMAGEKPHLVSQVDRDYLIEEDISAEVKELQEKLINLEYNLGSYGADGVYGNTTVQALKSFQRDNNLTVDGIYGQVSQEKMEQVLQEKKGGLTMSEYSELKDLIGKQNREIGELKDRLADKMDTTSSSNEPSDTHTDAWQWLIDEGITYGTTPLNYTTREQTGTMLKRYNENNEYLPNWMYDAIVDRFEGVAPYLHKPEEWKEKLTNHKIAVPELLGVFMLAFLNKENTDKALK